MWLIPVSSALVSQPNASEDWSTSLLPLPDSAPNHCLPGPPRCPSLPFPFPPAAKQLQERPVTAYPQPKVGMLHLSMHTQKWLKLNCRRIPWGSDKARVLQELVKQTPICQKEPFPFPQERGDLWLPIYIYLWHPSAYQSRC